ncbi:hypothetical protein PIB30_066060 [Stylosanthes scabra]|uniref:Uncharacterized protein n=1 Tax=Stylosanthes scabra TaxID=79078 RepID=A0ABU6RMJ7_9FABA|nr:hypothetical protein [Stylosanthes scabra]
MGGTNSVPNVLCIHNNVEPRSQQNSSKSRVTGKNSPCLQIGGFSVAWCVCTIVRCASSSAGTRKLRSQPLGVAWAAPVLLVSCLRSFKAAWAALLVLVHPTSNFTSNNPFFLAFLHESFASNALFSTSKSFLNP